MEILSEKWIEEKIVLSHDFVEQVLLDAELVREMIALSEEDRVYGFSWKRVTSASPWLNPEC